MYITRKCIVFICIHGWQGASAELFLVGLGLIAGGGNALWLASFPIAQGLFKSDGHGATAAATLSAMWNLSGLVYTVLAFPKVTVANLFFISAVWNAVALVIVAAIFPNGDSTSTEPLELPRSHIEDMSIENMITADEEVEEANGRQVASPLTLSVTLLNGDGEACGEAHNGSSVDYKNGSTRMRQSIENSANVRRKKGYERAGERVEREEGGEGQGGSVRASDAALAINSREAASLDWKWTTVVIDVRLWW